MFTFITPDGVRGRWVVSMHISQRCHLQVIGSTTLWLVKPKGKVNSVSIA